MDQMRQQKDRYRRDRDDSRYKHASKDQDRGRTYNYSPPSKNYPEDLKRYDRDRSRRRIRSRSASPVKGPEEYLTRKKLNTDILSKNNTETTTRERLSPKRVMYSSEEIRQKIIQYVVKPNEGGKRNFINMKIELDSALKLINEQKRLEISKILRRTTISLTSRDGNVPIVADIGVDLRRHVMEELSMILGIDLEQLGLGTWLDPSEPFHPGLGHAFSTTVATTIPDTSKLYDPHDPTVDDIRPEPDYIKINEPNFDNNKQIEKECRSELPLVEVKKEPEEITDPPDDVFVETFSSQRHEQTSNNDYGEYERMTAINDLDNHRESSPKLHYSVRLIEATIKAFVDIDKTESDPHYTSFNELMDKIEGLERCSKLLDDYKNYLMKNLFCSFRKLHKVGQRYDSPQSPNNLKERLSNGLQSGLRENSEGAVGIRKRDCGEESAQKAKKIKLVEKVHQPRPARFPNIEDRVTCLKYRHFTPEGGHDCLMIGTESGKVLIMDLATNRIYQTLKVCDGSITSLCLYQKYQLYVGTATKLLNVYSRDNSASATRGQRQLLTSHPMTNLILCIIFYGNQIYIGCQKGTIIKYGPKERCIKLETTSESGLDITWMKAKKEGQGTILIVSQRSGPIVIRDAESLLQLRIFSNQPEVMLSTVSAVDYLEGKLICGTVEGDVLQFDYHVENAQLEHRLKVSGSKGITCMQLLKNVLMVGCANGRVYLYNTLHKLALLKVLEGPGGSVNCVVFLRKQIAISTVTCKLVRIDIPPEILLAFNDPPAPWR